MLKMCLWVSNNEKVGYRLKTKPLFKVNTNDTYFLFITIICNIGRLILYSPN